MAVSNSDKRKPMDVETVLALVMLVVALVIFGGFSVLVWSGLLNDLAH